MYVLVVSIVVIKLAYTSAEGPGFKPQVNCIVNGSYRVAACVGCKDSRQCFVGFGQRLGKRLKEKQSLRDG